MLNGRAWKDDYKYQNKKSMGAHNLCYYWKLFWKCWPMQLGKKIIKGLKFLFTTLSPMVLFAVIPQIIINKTNKKQQKVHFYLHSIGL